MFQLSWYNTSTCLLVAVGGWAYGFGFAGFTTSTGQPAFYAYFDLDRECFFFVHCVMVFKLTNDSY
jgi:hypothetical protein